MRQDDRRAPTTPRRMTRRTWLQGAATTTGAVAVAGLPGILAHAQAPAYPRGTRLHLLQWAHYIQAADVLFDQQTAEFAKQAGVQIQVERINQNDIQARATAAIQAQTGPDIVIIANNHAQLYEAALADVSDVAEAIGGQQGGWYDYATFGIPGTKAYFDHALWTKDPKTTVFRETLQSARQVGHAGPPGRKATEALSKYIIVDMFARSLQGMAPEEAVKWAAAELRKIYGA